jgi:hypothetical protein
MTDDFYKFIARYPRHQSADKAELQIKVRRSVDKSDSLGAKLVDFSRDGFRLRVGAPLTVEEAVEVQVADGTSPVHLAILATVRWQRPEGGRIWLTGFEFNRSTDWETLGELFLNEILSTDG